MNTAITVPQFRSITCRDRRPEPASRVDDADHTGWPAPRWPASNVRAWRFAPPPGGPQALRSLVLDLSVRVEAARAVLSGAGFSWRGRHILFGSRKRERCSVWEAGSQRAKILRCDHRATQQRQDPGGFGLPAGDDLPVGGEPADRQAIG